MSCIVFLMSFQTIYSINYDVTYVACVYTFDFYKYTKCDKYDVKLKSTFLQKNNLTNMMSNIKAHFYNNYESYFYENMQYCS